MHFKEFLEQVKQIISNESNHINKIKLISEIFEK